MLSSSGNLRFVYPLAAALIISPLLELAVRFWPLQLHLAQWRFQSELALLNATTLILLGLLVAGLIAWATEASGILRAVAAISVLMGVLLLPVLGMFLLDGQQMQQMAQSNMRGALRNNTYVAFIKGGLSMLAAFSLGIALWRAARAGDVEPRRRSVGSRQSASDDNDVLLVSTER